MSGSHPVVGVVMGSSSDWEVMRHAVEVLEAFGVPHEAKVVSAHRMPTRCLPLLKARRRVVCERSSRAQAGRRICRA
jgi:5-(carboxyamino)imidazole ribonucleotide mutase